MNCDFKNQPGYNLTDELRDESLPGSTEENQPFFERKPSYGTEQESGSIFSRSDPHTSLLSYQRTTSSFSSKNDSLSNHSIKKPTDTSPVASPTTPPTLTFSTLHQDSNKQPALDPQHLLSEADNAAANYHCCLGQFSHASPDSQDEKAHSWLEAIHDCVNKYFDYKSQLRHQWEKRKAKLRSESKSLLTSLAPKDREMLKNIQHQEIFYCFRMARMIRDIGSIDALKYPNSQQRFLETQQSLEEKLDASLNQFYLFLEDDAPFVSEKTLSSEPLKQQMLPWLDQQENGAIDWVASYKNYNTQLQSKLAHLHMLPSTAVRDAQKRDLALERWQLNQANGNEHLIFNDLEDIMNHTDNFLTKAYIESMVGKEELERALR